MSKCWFSLDLGDNLHQSMNLFQKPTQERPTMTRYAALYAGALFGAIALGSTSVQAPTKPTTATAALFGYRRAAVITASATSD
jgi:hypothetical protein